MAAFCGPECQKKAWAEHRVDCRYQENKLNTFELVGVKIQTIFRPRIVKLSILENKGQGLVLTRYVFYCDMIR